MTVSRRLVSLTQIAYCTPHNAYRIACEKGSPMRVAVLGAGAIGAYVGASLCRSGVDVHLIARGAHLAALRAHGVRVLSPRGDFSAHPHATVPALARLYR